MPAPSTRRRISRAGLSCRKTFAKLLGLKGEVTLVGGRGRFEIWNSAKWKQAHREEKATYQRVADVIGL